MRPVNLCMCLAVLLHTSWSSAGGKDEVKATNLEKLNTSGDESDPFPIDANRLLYVGAGKGGLEIKLSQRTSAVGAWPAGKTWISGDDFDCRAPFLYQGKTLYYASNKVPDPKFKDLKNFDIQQKFGDIAGTPLLVLNAAQDDLFPWVTAAGKEFYFSRRTKDGWKLLVAPGPVPGPIGAGKPVGLPDDFHHATFMPSGLTMFVQGPTDDGRQGIFRTKRTSLTAAWSAPEPFKALNTAEGKQGNLCPSLNADGTRLYFASDRPGGKGGLDVWTVLVKDLK